MTGGPKHARRRRRARRAAQTSRADALRGRSRGARRRAAAPADEPAAAARWRRLAAYAIDCLVILTLTGALWGRLAYSVVSRIGDVASAFPGGGAPESAAYGRIAAQTAGVFLVELVTTACVAIAYYWLLTAHWGTTIGKRCLRTWVVSSRDASRARSGAALARAAIFVLAGWAVALFFLADNVWLLWDARRQSLHDKIAGTVVVRAPGR